ncbi:MAG: septum formation initiator family protein [Desulfovibrio sp.]|jgi:cell division protein FtsB|nr:septum formation initiator family protein [Desulfovibrio sp.]
MMIWRVFILVALTLINVALFGRMIWGSTGLLEYRELKNQHAALQKQLEKLDAKNLSLSREIRMLQSDRQYMEKMIRRHLHYVRENEVLYLFDNAMKITSGGTRDGGKN